VITAFTNVCPADRCFFDSGANRHIFTNKSWLESTHSSPLTPTSTSIHGISGPIPATKQCIIRNQPALICPSAKDNVLSLGWMTQFPSIVTTFSSVYNTFRVKFGSITFTVPMSSDSHYYLSKSHVKLLLTHVNSLTDKPRANVSTAFTKEQLSRADEVKRLHSALLHPSDNVLIKALKYC
jgi:hypothetical protein